MSPRIPGFAVATVSVALAFAAVSCGGVTATPSTASVAPGTTPSAAPATTPSPSASRDCEPPTAAVTRWWDDRVFYEVFVRSFRDSDGDGIGDLAGLTERLDYLNDGDPATTDDLGITGIWLMPVAEAASYHGYDVTDYRAIEPDYGTTEDFRAFLAAAHERGIAVIVDLVMNHTSRDHPWFRDAITPGSEHDDWYVWSDDDPGYGGPDGQDVWHEAGGRSYYGLFWEGMPDLDLTNPDVQAEMDGVARYWLEDLGVDGFRLDAIKHFVEEGEDQENTDASHAWLEGFHERVHDMAPDGLLVGEVFDASIVSSSYVPEAVDLTFDFELAGKLLNGVRAAHGETVAAGQAKALELHTGGQFGAFLTNHDQNRVATTLRGEGMLRMAASLLLTNPGIPFLYYGEEVGLPGSKPDERIRTPMPWDGTPGGGFTNGTPWEPFEDGWQDRNVEAQAADEASLLSHYRALIHARDRVTQLRSGTWTSVEAEATSAYGFVVRDADAGAAVILNLGDEPVVAGLTVDALAVCGLRPGEVVLADGYGTAPEPAPFPSPDPATDEVAWQPVPELPPFSTLVVRLSP